MQADQGSPVVRAGRAAPVAVVGQALLVAPAGKVALAVAQVEPLVVLVVRVVFRDEVVLADAERPLARSVDQVVGPQRGASQSALSARNLTTCRHRSWKAFGSPVVVAQSCGFRAVRA